MLLSRLAESSEALSKTRSRIAKRDLLAEVLREAEAEELEIVVSHLAGSLRQRRTGVGWRSLASLPAPAEVPTLTVTEVDAAFESVARLAGAGSAAARSIAVGSLFERATRREQDFLAGLVSGELRQGALDALVQDGLAAAYDMPPAVIRRAAMLLSSTSAAARLLAHGGRSALEAVGLQIGTAVQPMLAASAPGPVQALEKTGLPALVDAKLDGIRVQVHRDRDEISVFTRSLEEITGRLPEVVAAVAELPVQRLVLDGEVLAMRDDGTPEKFQVIASRTASSVDLLSVVERTPLRAYFFDLLHVDGADLLDQPLAERAETMADVLPPDLIVPRKRCADADEVAETFADAVRRGYEGVVVKDLAGRYAAGRRDSGWVKVKPRQTFDLLVTAAEWGHGRRRGWLSNIHLAARDPTSDRLIMLGKTFKGMTDEMLAWQTERFLELELRRSADTVYLRPTMVVEVACDGLQNSTRYPGGVALRFARVLRYRPDKSPAEADTIETVKAVGSSPLAPGASRPVS